MTYSPPSYTPFSLDLPPLLLKDPRSHLRLRFTASLQVQLPDPSWLVDDKWKGLEMIRGIGFCLNIKLRLNNHQAPEGLVEGFGQWISKAEMWSQLLLSTSLQVLERKGREEEVVDIIIDLIRSSPIPAATELLISTIRPTAPLTCIVLGFSFSRKGPLKNHNVSPRLLELIPLADTTFRSFWSNRVLGLAPILGKVGYLESVSEKAEYVSVVAEAITRVAGRSQDVVLRGAVDCLEGRGRVGGVERRVWDVLLGVLGSKKGGARSRLKSMVTDEQIIENKDEIRFEDSLLLEEESVEDGRDSDEDMWFETETEDELFTWGDEDGDCPEEDNLFIWGGDDKHREEGDTCLFGELEDLGVRMDYHGEEKEEFLFMEDHELILEGNLLMRGEDEDMIWI